MGIYASFAQVENRRLYVHFAPIIAQLSTSNEKENFV